MRTIASCCLLLGMVSAASGIACAQGAPNKLTSKESANGWKLLFDGKTLGWMAALQYLEAARDR